MVTTPHASKAVVSVLDIRFRHTSNLRYIHNTVYENSYFQFARF